MCFVCFVCFVVSRDVGAQALTQRGFFEGSAMLFPQDAPNDPVRAVGDFLAREELFLKPAPWMQFAGGLELRANSHDQVDDCSHLDVDDRGVKRPCLSLRRLTATFTRGPLFGPLGSIVPSVPEPRISWVEVSVETLLTIHWAQLVPPAPR